VYDYTDLITYLINKGLESNERIFFSADSENTNIILHHLSSKGINIDDLIANEQLALNVYELKQICHEVTSTHAILEMIQKEVSDASSKGFDGLRVIGEMSFAKTCNFSNSEIIEHEFKIDEYANSSNMCSIFCFFNKNLFPASIILDILLTQKAICVGTDIYENFICIPKDVLLKNNRDKVLLDFWIKNLMERTKIDESFFLDSIIENIPNMILIKDAADLKFMKLNRAGEQLLGYSRDEFIGKNDYDFFPREEADFFTSRDREVLENKELMDIEEETIHTKNMGTRYLHTKKIPLLNEEGRPLYLLGISEDITEKKLAEKKLSLNESLLKEIHHRVKNNLQVISSFLDLQTYYVKNRDVIKILKTSQSRISSIALVYDHLCKSKEVSNIYMKEYIKELTNSLTIYHYWRNGNININNNIEDILLDINKAMPCGLIINELITNSLKHAFPFEKEGTINVELRKNNNKYNLKVSDNGIGLPDSFSIENSDSLGLQIVASLTKQINAQMEIHTTNGSEFCIEFD